MKAKQFIFNHISEDTRNALRLVVQWFWYINWFKTIWFNLRALPWSQAHRLPFVLGWNVKILRCGNIVLNGPVRPLSISMGVIRILQWDNTSEPLRWYNEGEVHFGGRAKFHPGVKITVGQGALLEFADQVLLGACTKLLCFKHVRMGCNSRLSWNCQLFDSDFHFLRNLSTGRVYQRFKPVILGDDVSVGNGCTIAKGTKLPDGCVVSCISLVRGDFTPQGDHLLIKGNTAEVVKTGVEISSSWRPEQEAEFARQEQQS